MPAQDAAANHELWGFDMADQLEIQETWLIDDMYVQIPMAWLR